MIQHTSFYILKIIVIKSRDLDLNSKYFTYLAILTSGMVKCKIIFMGKNIIHLANFIEPIGSCKFGLSNKNSSKLIGLNGLQSYLGEKKIFFRKKLHLLRFSV